jgi:peptidoglycan hydrolase CwlO-like protein
MGLKRRRCRRAVAAIVLAAAAGATSAPASDTDIGTLRERAQRIADEVTALERGLRQLRDERARVERDIVRGTQELALLERRANDLAREVAAARARYVERAVEAYKDGAVSPLAVILAADDVSELLAAAEAASRAASADIGTLKRFRAALGRARRVQAEVDERKQDLLRARARTEELGAEIESALGRRGAALERLQGRIDELVRQARLQAARAARADEAFVELLAASGPAADIPHGYVGTGITFEGIASWYGPGFAGETTANGQIFDPDLYTAASRDLPFGTVLFVRYRDKGVVVVINDRGPYLQERILDLSRAAAEAIGLGLGWITAEIVVPAPEAR